MLKIRVKFEGEKSSSAHKHMICFRAQRKIRTDIETRPYFSSLLMLNEFPFFSFPPSRYTYALYVPLRNMFGKSVVFDAEKPNFITFWRKKICMSEFLGHVLGEN